MSYGPKASILGPYLLGKLMVKRGLRLATIVTAHFVLFAQVASAETRLSFSSGVDYSSGDYGDTMDTEVVAVPLSARLATDNWSFRVSLPYLSITGPADVADTLDGGGDAGDGAGADGTIARTGTERGFGDTSISATRSFRRLGGRDSNAYFDLTARVRLSTGDESKGLGVGTTDYILNGELGSSGDVGGGYVSAGYRSLGDRKGVNRQDGWQAGVGGWLRAGDKTRVGAFYSWRDASLDGNEDPSEVGAYVSYRMSEALRVSVNAAAGLSEASPDYSAGVRFTWRSDPIHR